MKIADLGKSAFNAEVFLWKKKTSRVGKQIVFLVAAALFGLFTLISFHALLAAICWVWLDVGLISTAAIVCGVDIFFMLLMLIFSRQKITAEEIEARFNRNNNLNELRNTLALTTVINALSGPLGSYLGQRLWNLLGKLFRRKK